jgi:mRNA interferase MazF
VVAYPKRGDVYVVTLDPTMGAEMQKIRPAMVISPDELNRHLATVIVAPITSTLRGYPYRVKCRLQNKPGSIALDQLRAVDKSRLLKRITRIDVCWHRCLPRNAQSSSLKDGGRRCEAASGAPLHPCTRRSRLSQSWVHQALENPRRIRPVGPQQHARHTQNSTTSPTVIVLLHRFGDLTIWVV